MSEKPKTYKRELAAAQLAFWWALVGLTVYALIWKPDASHRELQDFVSGIGILVMAFAAGAFGIDWYSRQLGAKNSHQSEDRK